MSSPAIDLPFLFLFFLIFIFLFLFSFFFFFGALCFLLFSDKNCFSISLIFISIHRYVVYYRTDEHFNFIRKVDIHKCALHLAHVNLTLHKNITMRDIRMHSDLASKRRKMGKEGVCILFLLCSYIFLIVL